MMLIAGYCGIGKSALVQELYKPITRQRGYLSLVNLTSLRAIFSMVL
jgi:predicted ATPase